jgi:hypothetical protein
MRLLIPFIFPLSCGFTCEIACSPLIETPPAYFACLVLCIAAWEES